MIKHFFSISENGFLVVEYRHKKLLFDNLILIVTDFIFAELPLKFSVVCMSLVALDAALTFCV